MKEYLHRSIIFVYLLEDNIIGFIIVRPFPWQNGLCYIVEEFAVSSEHQGKGYGKLLIEHVENIARKKGAVKIELFAAKKSKAYRIYKKLRFREDKKYIYMFKKLNK